MHADQREVWTISVESGPLESSLRALAAVLSAPAAADDHGQGFQDDLVVELMYVLAFLRTSQCLELLSRMNGRQPGIADQLVTRAMNPSGPNSREAALLHNRLLYLMRHHAAQQIFCPARRAEVMAAVVAARQ
jgi:hypothetical protein